MCLWVEKVFKQLKRNNPMEVMAGHKESNKILGCDAPPSSGYHGNLQMLLLSCIHLLFVGFLELRSLFNALLFFRYSRLV